MFGKVKSDELEVRINDGSTVFLRNISGDELILMMTSRKKPTLEAHKGDNNFFDIRVSDIKEIIKESSNISESLFKKFVA